LPNLTVIIDKLFGIECGLEAGTEAISSNTLLLLEHLHLNVHFVLLPLKCIKNFGTKINTVFTFVDGPGFVHRLEKRILGIFWGMRFLVQTFLYHWVALDYLLQSITLVQVDPHHFLFKLNLILLAMAAECSD
jgi:hypothetical protein